MHRHDSDVGDVDRLLILETELKVSYAMMALAYKMSLLAACEKMVCEKSLTQVTKVGTTGL